MQQNPYIMKNTFPSCFLAIFLMAMLISSCSTTPQFSKSRPYALELARVRSYFQAQQLERRLIDMEIPVYQRILTDAGDESSQWYVLLTGAAKDSVEMTNLRDKLESEHELEGLALANYGEMKDELKKLKKRKVEEAERMLAERPDIPFSMYELIEKFPTNDQFNIEQVALYQFQDDGVNSPSYYESALDLPRGVSRGLVARQCEDFAEVIYKDNLYGDQFTVDILKIEDPSDLITSAPNLPEPSTSSYEDHLKIAWYYGQKILNTGRYYTEEYEEVVVESYTDLHGYKVVIEPRRGYIRTYMVLVDLTGGYVVFSQSTDKTDEEILAYLADFGRSQGMLDYNEFYNVFFTIPYCLAEEGDVFLGYSSHVLDDSYAWMRGYVDWSKAMVGHTSSMAEFYNVNSKQYWSSSIFDLITESKKDYIYNDMYAKQEGDNKEKLSVNGRTGFFVIGYGTREVNFTGAGRHLFAVNSPTMARENLIERANKFQSGQKRTGGNPCAGQPPEAASQEPAEEEPTPPVTEEPTSNPEQPSLPNQEQEKPSTSGENCMNQEVVTEYPIEAKRYERTFPLTGATTGLNNIYGRWTSTANWVLPTPASGALDECRQLGMDFTFFKDHPIVVRTNSNKKAVDIYSLPGHRLHPFHVQRRLIKAQNGDFELQTAVVTTSTDPAIQELCSGLYWDKVDEVFHGGIRSQ
jgi:hypothetical protein